MILFNNKMIQHIPEVKLISDEVGGAIYKDTSIDVYVAVTQLDIGNQWGLFSNRTFKRGAIVTFYDGDTLGNAQCQRRPIKTHIAVSMWGVQCIDGLKTPELGRGGGSFANSSFVNTPFKKMYGHKVLARNAELYREADPKTGNRLLVKAVRTIQPGDEVFIKYRVTD